MPVTEQVEQQAQARLGTVLNGKWRLDSVIGVGGMATVYAATHRNKKRAAVKVLHRELSIDAGIRARFLREGYAANSIEHAGAVSVHDDDVAEDGSAYLVMELLEGEPVDVRLERKENRLPVTEALSIADQVLDALAAAHEKGIVHRDLKPENIFLTRSGSVKILDFGIARVREGGGSTSTRTGSLMGTPAFMAPEQARGRWDQVDAQTDLWAVGATLFTVLSGRFVHEAETPNETLGMAMNTPAPSLKKYCPDLPPAVIALVDKALSYNKSDRWLDAATMRAAVREAWVASGEPPDTLRPPVPSTADVSSIKLALQGTGDEQPTRFARAASIAGVSASNGGTSPDRRWKRAAWIGGAALLVVSLLVLVARVGTTPTPERASSSAAGAPAGSAPEPSATAIQVEPRPPAPEPSSESPAAAPPPTRSPALAPKPMRPKPRRKTNDDPFATRR